MSLRIDPALNSPRKPELAPSNMKKPELRSEKKATGSTSPAKKFDKPQEKNEVANKIEDTENTQGTKAIPQKRSHEVDEQDDDLLFSAELESQMESDEIASLEGLEEIKVTPKQAVTALSALAGIAAATATEQTNAPVEVIFNNAQNNVQNNVQEIPVNTPVAKSDLQALLAGDGKLNVEMPKTDASLYMADNNLLNAEPVLTEQGEVVVSSDAKLKLGKEAAANPANPKLVDNENVVDLLNQMNQKKNLRNPVQAQYANQNPKLVLEKIMKEVKAKAGVTEMTPDEAKMMKNLDMLTDADKMVKLVGGEKNTENKMELNTKGADKVFDMSKIKSTNANEIIDQISNHIIQNQTARSTNVDLAVNHADLGRININVSKLNPEQVNIQIMTHTPEGKQFFAENSRGLLNHLATNGVNVNDLKLDNTSSSNLNSGKDHSNSSEQFTGGGRGQHSANQSEDNNRRQDSKRREDLWDLYRRNAA